MKYSGSAVGVGLGVGVGMAGALDVDGPDGVVGEEAEPVESLHAPRASTIVSAASVTGFFNAASSELYLTWT
ncbi:hypothetical protein HMPREF3167_02905 [Trueperella sp. HMSC08B05]|nr:hypothetical protein HMPREF3174_06990 [Trueperella sp. HMSC08H06]OFS75780.1 hypothetical protein HMPREF3167_02905 [Trueperella sp. HMSC08B05]